MKLYLSSMPIINSKALHELIGNKKHPNVALIPNAWDAYPKERKEVEVAKFSNTLQNFGFVVSLLELTAVADKESLRNDLKSKDSVWVMGGNTFYLNYHLHRSGFKGIIQDLLKQGLIYCGDSAGAVVAGSTIHGIEHLDDPKLAPEVTWDGLKLVNFGIIPHWGWEKYGEFLEKAKQEMGKYTHVSTIGNDQALIIDGEELEVVAA